MEILLLTREHCAFCERAEQILQRLAAEYGLTVRTMPFDTPEAQAWALQAGVLFPPAIFIDGEPVAYGWPSERALRRAIERRLACPAPPQSGVNPA